MKKVKITNAEVIGLVGCLNALTSSGIDMKPRTWFTMAANRKALIEQGKLIDEANKEITDKYKGKDDEGNDIIPEKNILKFNQDKSDILTMESEIELHTLELSAIEKEMNKMKGVENIFLLFDYIIVDEPKKAKKK